MPMVVLGIDAHERTHTVVAVDEVGRQLGVRVTKSTSTAAPAAGGVGGPVRAGAPVGGRGLPASVAAAGAGLGGGRGGEIARVPPKLMVHVRDSARTYGRSDPIDALAPSLLALPGVADLTAAKIVAETAGADRFASKDAFARHNGTAPLPVWSGNQTRHRLSRTGNRQLNCDIHRIAVTQKRSHPNAQAYLRRRTDAGDTPAEALRAKRRLSDIVYRTLLADTVAITTRSGQAA